MSKELLLGTFIERTPVSFRAIKYNGPDDIKKLEEYVDIAYHYVRENGELLEKPNINENGRIFVKTGDWDDYNDEPDCIIVNIGDVIIIPNNNLRNFCITEEDFNDENSEFNKKFKRA